MLVSNVWIHLSQPGVGYNVTNRCQQNKSGFKRDDSTKVVAIAKKDLEEDESLDVFGGYTFRGLMKEKDEAFGENALPAALAPGARVIKKIPKGRVITWDNVKLDEASTLVRLRREQDAAYEVIQRS